MYAFTLVIDGKKGFSALTESYTLVYGRWWAVLGRLLALALSMMLVWITVTAIAFLFGILLQGSFIVMGLISLIGSAIITPIALGYMYKLYVSLKATRQANVSTVSFKKWLVAFLIIGIAIIPVTMIIAISLPH
jgi:hypothetical protein